MGRKRKAWTLAVGGRGHRVTVFEREAGGTLYLRWWDGERDNWAWRSLKHADRERGEQEARDLAASILAAVDTAHTGRITVAELFARYERDVTKHKKGAQPAEDRRRMRLWQHVLGADRAVETIDVNALDTFVRERRAGRITVPSPDEKAAKRRKLTTKPSETTIGADLIFLNAVVNWATRTTLQDGTRLLAENPIRSYRRPRTANPKRPVASYDRFLAVRAKADTVDPQRLFGAFMDIIEGLGWRVSAVCSLRGPDIDRSAHADYPHGRIHRRGDADKEGHDAWVPMPKSVRDAVDAIAVIGDRALFPCPRPKKGKPPTSWTRFHARALLARAETAAGLEPIDGGDWHPFRRAWATSRKHLPTRDVAALGGWSDLRSLETCYQRTDAATLLAVALDTTKLRERKASGAPSGG